MRSDYDRIMVFNLYYYMCLHLDSQRDQFTNIKYSCNKWYVVKRAAFLFFFNLRVEFQMNESSTGVPNEWDFFLNLLLIRNYHKGKYLH